MTGFRGVAGIMCLGLAGLMLVANVSVLWEPGLTVPRAIGVFFLPLILVIVAIKLLQKPKSGP